PRSHHQIRSNYKIYLTYGLTFVSFSLRSSEYNARNAQYHMIGNAIVEQISRNQDGNFTGVVHLEGYKTTVLKLTWLLEIIELVGFDYLITKKKVC
ncbi:hypothetical protein CISIN_1g042647mg, partial [Citrus sinensis]